jgi:hypothetical protein
MVAIAKTCVVLHNMFVVRKYIYSSNVARGLSRECLDASEITDFDVVPVDK